MKPYKTQAIGGILGEEGWESGSLAKDKGLALIPFVERNPFLTLSLQRTHIWGAARLIMTRIIVASCH